MSKNIETTIKIINKENRNQYLIPLPSWIARFLKHLHLIPQGLLVKKDKNGRPGEEIRFTRTSTITSFKLKTGDVLYVTPKAGTRFVTEDAEENNGNMSTSGSSNSLASMASVTSLKSANNVVIPAFVEVRISKKELDSLIRCLFMFYLTHVVN